MAEPIFQNVISREAEEAVAGAVLIDADLIRLIDLDPEDFYFQHTREAWEAFRALDAEGTQIDYLVTSNWLLKNRKGAKISDLMALLTATPTTLHAEEYAKIVKDLSSRRKTVIAAQELVKGALDKSCEIDTTLSTFAMKIPNLAHVRGGAKHISYYASRHYDRVGENADNPKKMAGYSTGFVDLDAATGGIRTGELTILSGKPGLGKTLLLMQLGSQLAENGAPGAIYEMETSEDQIMDRELSRRTKIDSDKFERGDLTDGEWPIYTDAIDRLSGNDYGLYLDFNSSWTTISLRADLIRMKARYGIQWFAVDYLKFLSDRYGKDETERENFISLQLKRITRELNIAGVVIHSMNKAGMTAAVADLESLSGGAGIAFDCDKALFMMEHVPPDGEAKQENLRTIVIQKSRSKLGTKVVHLVKLPGWPAFGDLKK